MAWSIYWIIIGSFVQAQGFSTTIVKVGEDAILECGLQTTGKEDYLRWQAITNENPEELAYDLRDRIPRCNDRIIKCTLYANGSIQLESVSMEDGARYYRCLRGDDNGYNYYSDHRLLVLSKESPSISQSPTSAIAFKASRKGIVHSYGEPVCEDDVDGNLPVVCYPPSGVIVDREYETIQCNCTDSDGLMDSVTFPVTRETSSPPSIETPHRESVSSYHIGKKGVLHGYNAPVCEDDVDGNLPVVCYPPSGVIVDREYETIQCNCTDSDGLMDSVTFPVTSITHWVHPGWKKATISLLVISILISFVLILICCNMCKNLKRWNAFYKRVTQSESQVMPLKQLQEMLEMLEAMNNKLEEQHEKSSKSSTRSESQVMPLKQLLEMLETMNNTLEEQHEKIFKTLTQSESQVMPLQGLQGMLEMRKKMLETMKNNLEEQHENIFKTLTQSESQVMPLQGLQGMLEMRKKMLETMKNNLEEQHENSSKRSTQNESQESLLKQLQEMLEMQEMLETMNNTLEEQHEKISKTSTQSESQVMPLKGLQGMLEMRKKMLETMKNNLEEPHGNSSKRSTQNESQESLLKQLQEMLEMQEMLETMNNKLEEQHEKSMKTVKGCNQTTGGEQDQKILESSLL